MRKHFVFGIGGLLIGLAIGFFVANSVNRLSATGASGASVDAATIPATNPEQPNNSNSTPPDIAELLVVANSQSGSFAAQMRVGDMYARIGRFEIAVEYYRKGLALRPDDFNANVVLANALFDSRQFEPAAEYYAKALRITPRDADARADLAATYIERQQPEYSKAVAELEKVLEGEPNHEAALYYLSIANFRSGRNEKGVEYKQRLEKTSTNVALIERLKQASEN
ncbi:MAG: tetratricopeptide repeat protein [Acidobacteria bacterium]|nr:tetratricopeptide repeat protein [Acidobacteriota bacterium]